MYRARRSSGRLRGGTGGDGGIQRRRRREARTRGRASRSGRTARRRARGRRRCRNTRRRLSSASSVPEENLGMNKTARAARRPGWNADATRTARTRRVPCDEGANGVCGITRRGDAPRGGICASRKQRQLTSVIAATHKIQPGTPLGHPFPISCEPTGQRAADARATADNKSARGERRKTARVSSRDEDAALRIHARGTSRARRTTEPSHSFLTSRSPEAIVPPPPPSPPSPASASRP